MSNIVFHAIAAAQKTGAVCAYIDTRHNADLDAMKAAGIVVADLLVSQPDSANQGADIATKLAKTGAVELIALDCSLLNLHATARLLDVAALNKIAILFSA